MGMRIVSSASMRTMDVREKPHTSDASKKNLYFGMFVNDMRYVHKRKENSKDEQMCACSQIHIKIK